MTRWQVALDQEAGSTTINRAHLDYFYWLALLGGFAQAAYVYCEQVYAHKGTISVQ